jgi:hypothetical protein
LSLEHLLDRKRLLQRIERSQPCLQTLLTIHFFFIISMRRCERGATVGIDSNRRSIRSDIFLVVYVKPRTIDLLLSVHLLPLPLAHAIAVWIRSQPIAHDRHGDSLYCMALTVLLCVLIHDETIDPYSKALYSETASFAILLDSRQRRQFSKQGAR